MTTTTTPTLPSELAPCPTPLTQAERERRQRTIDELIWNVIERLERIDRREKQTA